MEAAPAPSVGRLRPWYAFLPSAILVAPVLSFLGHNNYSLVRPEALVWTGSAIAVGGAVGIVALRVPPWLRALLVAACLAAFLDVQFHLGHLGRRKLTLIALGIALVVWLLRENAFPILAAGFGVLVLSILIVPGSAPLQRASAVAEERGVKPRAGLPPLIVLVLDEHIGLEGIPLDVEGGAETKEILESLYADHGFRLYTRAYSQYFDTHDSLPNVLNFSARGVSEVWVSKKGNQYVLAKNEFLSRASEAGYALRIYESDYLVFSEPAGVDAEFRLTYRASSVGSIQDEGLALGQALRLLGRANLAGSVLYETVRALHLRLVDLGVPLGPPAERYLAIGPFESMAVLDRVEADVVAAADNRAFLVHLTLPHYPYVYDEACGVKPDVSTWLNRRGELSIPTESLGGPKSWRRLRYRDYLAQLRCLAGRLNSFFAALKTGGVLERAVIVVMGDHGSRITANDPHAGNLDLLSPTDYIDGFSTLFAVRRGGVEPGIEERPYPLSRAFAEALGRNGGNQVPMGVFLRRRGMPSMTQVPMPAF